MQKTSGCSDQLKILCLITTIAFITWILMASHVFASSGLKVIVKLKYGDWIRTHGMGKAYFSYSDDSGDVSKNKDLSKKFPSKVTLKFPSGAVDVGEGFTVVLNSYKCDDASDASGINSPGKAPETVRITFPC